MPLICLRLIPPHHLPARSLKAILDAAFDRRPDIRRELVKDALRTLLNPLDCRREGVYSILLALSHVARLRRIERILDTLHEFRLSLIAFGLDAARVLSLENLAHSLSTVGQRPDCRLEG